MGILRLNHLQPPFDNPAIRRVVLSAIDQTEVLTGLAGTDRSMWSDRVGVFTPNSPMANDVGIEAVAAPRDYARIRRDLEAAGYRGERIAFLQATTLMTMSQPAAVAAEQMRRAGMNVDLIAVDFGVWLQRRASRNPVNENGWSCTTTLLPGFDLWDPISHLALRGNGLNAWPGWPTSPELERLRDAWVAAQTMEARRGIAGQIQQQAWQDVPYIPLGRWVDPTAHRRNITGMLSGAALFYNLRKA
jgi:peptide/nickel transport system substrate-binding protein